MPALTVAFCTFKRADRLDKLVAALRAQLRFRGEGITRVRGQWKRLEPQGIPVMPTFHPAYVLRQYTDDVRRAVWTDLKAARAWLDRPKG